MLPILLIRTSAIASALLLGACTVGERNAARVDCGAPGPNGVDCQVQRTGGDSPLQACWNLTITCRNGGAMTAPACHEMPADATQGVQNMPTADFSGQESCDVPTFGQVEHLKISDQ